MPRFLPSAARCVAAAAAALPSLFLPPCSLRAPPRSLGHAAPHTTPASPPLRRYCGSASVGSAGQGLLLRFSLSRLHCRAPSVQLRTTTIGCLTYEARATAADIRNSEWYHPDFQARDSGGRVVDREAAPAITRRRSIYNAQYSMPTSWDSRLERCSSWAREGEGQDENESGNARLSRRERHADVMHAFPPQARLGDPEAGRSVYNTPAPPSPSLHSSPPPAHPLHQPLTINTMANSCTCQSACR
ncbi:hypothetical protein C8Q79DRAFT_761083 [Trametes meyenii]|nr:hypothetical protein C8Q79DRAFT_761083 [Trametes meyenii]